MSANKTTIHESKKKLPIIGSNTSQIRSLVELDTAGYNGHQMTNVIHFKQEKQIAYLYKTGNENHI